MGEFLPITCLPLTCSQAVLVGSAHLQSQVSIQHWHKKTLNLPGVRVSSISALHCFTSPGKLTFPSTFSEAREGTDQHGSPDACITRISLISRMLNSNPAFLEIWTGGQCGHQQYQNISNDKYSIRFYQILSDSIIISYCIDQFLSGFLSFSFPNFIRFTASCKARDESDTARGTQVSVAFRRLNMGYPWAIHGYTMPQIFHSYP